MVIFDDVICKDSVFDFVRDVKEGIAQLQEHEKLIIYFSTNGGEMHLIPIILDVFYKYREYIEIRLNCVMQSAGLTLLIHLVKEFPDINIWVTDTFSNAMLHQVRTYLDTSCKNKEIVSKQVDEYNQKLLKSLKGKITKEEIKKFNNLEDLYFDRERVIKMFPSLLSVDYIL